MKGFKYLPNHESLIECKDIEDEICNGGPAVWAEMIRIMDCIKPCKINTYKGSDIEYLYHNSTSNEAHFSFQLGLVKTVSKELLIYDTNDMIGSIGGSLGLFLGFSFFQCGSLLMNSIMSCLKKFISNNRVRYESSN